MIKNDLLLAYLPSEWLAKCNPVIVKLIEVLTYNENKSQHQGEKLFKCGCNKLFSCSV